MHYVMTCEGPYPPTMIGTSPDVAGSPWNDGHPIEAPIDEPIVYALDPDYPGNMLALYDIAELLIRDDLLATLRRSGVDNLQVFRAIIEDPTTGSRHENYSAVNIVGVVAAADMAESVPMTAGGMSLGGFDSLVVDETRAGDLLMFRLAEAVNAIVIHERVRTEIEAAGIPGITFWEPGEWSG